MGTRPIIAVDIDDVIAMNVPSFIEYSNQKWGTHLTIDDYQEHWAEMWGVDHTETERRAREFHESGHVGTYKAIDGAKDVLEELKKRFRLVILTTRRNSINQITRDWLDAHYGGVFDDIVFSGFFDNLQEGNHKLTKGELAKSIGADYIIDDQLKHILAASDLGIRGVLFGDYPWNKSDMLPTNVFRASDWSSVSRYFKSEQSS